jgi:5'-methylthioadenosine nucleosidase
VDNVGTIPAALLTFLTLQKVPEADLLVNAGTCGGFKAKGAEIGDVFLTTAVANHDRRIPIPGFAAYGTGRSESQIEDLADVAASVHAKLGVCTTGNSLDKHDWDEKHMLENDASIKDMEAAAIAWSCSMSNNTPFMGVKVVTDIVDGFRPTDEEFLENLSHAAKSLQSSLPIIIDHVCASNNDSPKAEL